MAEALEFEISEFELEFEKGKSKKMMCKLKGTTSDKQRLAVEPPTGELKALLDSRRSGVTAWLKFDIKVNRATLVTSLDNPRLVLRTKTDT